MSDVPSLSLSLPTWVSQRAAGRVPHTGAGLVCGRAWRAASTCFLTLASLVLLFRYTRMHMAVCQKFLGLCDPEFFLEQPHPRRWALTLEGGGWGGGQGHQVRRLFLMDGPDHTGQAGPPSVENSSSRMCSISASFLRVAGSIRGQQEGLALIFLWLRCSDGTLRETWTVTLGS